MADNILYLSPAGGSGLRIADIFQCPRKVLLKRRGWKFRRVPSYFWYGGRIHHWAFQPYLNPGVVKDLAAAAREDVTNIIASGMSPYEYTDSTGTLCKSESPVDIKESSADLPRIAEVQMDVWSERLYRPEDVTECEKKMVCGVVDPRTGQVSNEAVELRVKFAFRKDLCLGTGGMGGVTKAIRDFKTCGAPLKDIPTKEPDYHTQLSMYRYGNAVITETDITDVGLFQMVKYKTRESVSKYAVDIPLVRPLSFISIYEKIMAAARLVRQCEANAERMNPEDAWPKGYACQARYGICEFLPLCSPESWGTQAELDTFVSENLVKTERG